MAYGIFIYTIIIKDEVPKIELPSEITKPGTAKEISIGCLVGFCSGYATKKVIYSFLY